MVDPRSIYFSRHEPRQAEDTRIVAGRHDVIAEIHREVIKPDASALGIVRAMQLGRIGSNKIGLGIAIGSTASAGGRPA
jgi:hypothetical protein